MKWSKHKGQALSLLFAILLVWFPFFPFYSKIIASIILGIIAVLEAFR